MQWCFVLFLTAQTAIAQKGSAPPVETALNPNWVQVPKEQMARCTDAGASADQKTKRALDEVEKIMRNSALPHSNETQNRVVYRVDRGLDFYSGYFSELRVAWTNLLPLNEFIKNLKPHQRWIDIGAGEAKAAGDYFNRVFTGNFAHVVAVTVEAYRPQIRADAQNRFQYLTGRYFEDIPNEELGVFDVATDIHGAVAYSTRLSEVFQKAGEVLKKGSGLFFTILRRTRILDADCRPVPIDVWVDSFSGFDRLPNPRPNDQAIDGVDWRLVFNRNHAPLIIPPLELHDLVPATPPYRTFRWAIRKQ